MASIVLPTATEVERYTGVTRYLTGDGESAFRAQLSALVTDAEAETAVAVGEDAFDGSAWTTRQALLLKQAVALRAGVGLLTYCMVQDATGTQQPLLMEDSDRIEAVAAALTTRARKLENIVLAGVPEENFALPAVLSSGITITDDDPTPAGKNARMDERADTWADDDRETL